MKINSLIATVMQTNGILGLIDKYRNNDTITLKEVQKEWNDMYLIKGNEYFFLSQYQYITSLLAFIVIPKENIFTELPDLKISELPNGWGIKDKGDFDLKYFIRRMRNSISHGSINVEENMTFSFIDANPKKTSDVCNCIFTEEKLRKFIHAFAWWIMTKKNRIIASH